MAKKKNDSSNLFANPFNLTNNDRRQLNDFFDDDGDDGYERVNHHNPDDEYGNTYHDSRGNDDVERGNDDDDADEYEYGNGRPRSSSSSRRRMEDDTLGGVMPNMFSTNHSSSVNVVWLTVLISLLFFLGGYYGLSKQANERARDQNAAASMEGSSNSAAGGNAEDVPVVPGADDSGQDGFHIFNSKNNDLSDGYEEEVGPALTFSMDSNPRNFDPFQLQKQQSPQLLQLQPKKIKEENVWPGAPFVVSPPQLPGATANGDEDDSSSIGKGNISGSSNRRLGYIQNPTIVNGTIVFSTEGDLYLTRLPENKNDNDIPIMTAMKLTTTVGNALHPKLNPKHPHLLVYSATYSGTREVYLMDLRPVTTLTANTVLGAPGTPGGPALRLTYTPGGVLSVVGWDADGSSILYSGHSRDVRALPDVRLFRLRLSWGKESSDSGDEELVANSEDTDKSSDNSKVTSVHKNKKNESKDATPHEGSTEVEEIEAKVENVNESEEKDEKANNNPQNGEPKESSEPQEWEDDDDDDEVEYSVDEAQKYVDKIAPRDNPTKVKGTENGPKEGSGNKVSNSSKNTPKNDKKGDGKNSKEDDANERRKLKRQERQRRHMAKLAASQQARRRGSIAEKGSSVHSIVEPVPLAQAREGVYDFTSKASNTEESCIYFTRFKQSSNTKRYVGGTAESLWAYCPDKFEDVALPLTSDYNGTSKSPSVYPMHGDDGIKGNALLFMSDRAPSKLNVTEWVPSSMELWAAPLPLSPNGGFGTPVRLTNVACQFDGIDLSEYSVDPLSGGIILRVGADLHFMPMKAVMEKLQTLSSLKGNNNQESNTVPSIQQLPIAVYSDFSNMQERLLPIQIPHHVTTLDAYSTSYGVSTLVTARGQTFVAPVIADLKGITVTGYGGGGRNMLPRRYKVAPGTGGGGLVRILSAKHVPQPSTTSSPKDSGQRLALLLATDPLSPTGEHAFYLMRTDAKSSPAFGFAALYEYGDYVVDTGLPAPFVGGHLETGGSTKEGGLGSVYEDTIKISPCGRRFAFTDTDGRIVTMTIPTTPVKTEDGRNLQEVNIAVLPPVNEINQPLIGADDTELVWSPGGRYLAIEHSARNQFKVISIADLGSPESGKIEIGRIVQATVDRFNSFSPVWGHATKDFVVEYATSAMNPIQPSAGSGATALIFLSDRDVKITGKTSPWGTQAPSPTFDGKTCVHILPLQSEEDALGQNVINGFIKAPYGGGGASEVTMEGVQELELLLELMQNQQEMILPTEEGNVTAKSTHLANDEINATIQTTGENDNTTTANENPFVLDTLISFGEEKDESYQFARSSYRIDHIPAGKYLEIVCQLDDDPSLLLLADLPTGYGLLLFAISEWPNDGTELVPSEQILQDVAISSDGQFIIAVQKGVLTVTPRSSKDVVAFFSDTDQEKNVALIEGLHLSVWPNLEYQQMYRDAWRLLRDYFYDPDMHSLDWDEIFDKYLPLVERCSKREELDDVLKQLIGELSALHAFVYGGEYSFPNHGDSLLEDINEVACLGATLQRSVENRGYVVVDIPERDPDLHMIDGEPMYSPLSNQALRLSGQVGLQAGDVIVAVNGENVMDVPDIHMLLRNTAGESVRLEVLRIESSSKLSETKRRLLQDNHTDAGIVPEPLVVVPMEPDDSEKLAYAAWEWKTRESAKSLAAEAGFSVGYVHLQSMSGAPSIDSFARGFYPDYDKDALIIDVRNNRGGNIDSWLLDTLQRTAWMYWESRSSNITTGGLGWDMQFAFRGHLVVLINEHTASDGEGFSRGVSELGLGKLVGKRTWGGGIWLSSDNHLVDGGIATAPEIGTYNDKFGWGLGIENMGVIPDVEVDNNPKLAYDGIDTQLEMAIDVLKEWLDKEPVALPKDPRHRPDMSKKEIVDGCTV